MIKIVIKDYFDKQKASITEQVTAKTTKADAIELTKDQIDRLISELDFDLTQDELQVTLDKLTELYSQLGELAVNDAMAAINVADKIVLEDSLDYVKEYAVNRTAELIGKSIDENGKIIDNPDASMAITDTTRDEIASLVENAIANGATNDELAQELADAYGFSSERAEMIARTETNIADNDITLNTYKNGGVEKKQWWTANDDLVSEECMANQDDGVIGINENFSSGDEAPPTHPNCRCTILAVFEDLPEDN